MAGWRYGRYHVYGSSLTTKIIQTNNLIITREAGRRYGIMSTLPYEQQKLYGQIMLLLHGNMNQPPVLLADAPLISYAVHVLNMIWKEFTARCEDDLLRLVAGLGAHSRAMAPCLGCGAHKRKQGGQGSHHQNRSCRGAHGHQYASHMNFYFNF